MHLGDGGYTCFSVADAQLESTYLVAVCEVSQCDAQLKGSSGNSCLQFETLLLLASPWVVLAHSLSSKEFLFTPYDTMKQHR